MSVFVSLARQVLIEVDLLYVTGPDIQQIMTDNTRHVMDVSRAPDITSHPDTTIQTKQSARVNIKS